MSVTIDLAPDVLERLRAKAELQGSGVEDYLKALAERDAFAADAWGALLDAVSEGTENWPVLPSVALERASFYGGRD